MNVRKEFVQLVVYLFVFMLSLNCLRADFGNSTRLNDAQIRCFDKEREALLKFKGELIDKDGKLSSWGTTQECCNWKGVRCDDKTNHIVSLGVTGVKGNMSSSLLELQYLNALNFKDNDFNGSTIPTFINSLTRLQRLDLSYSGFSRSVPPHLGNLSRLNYLDLSYNSLQGTIPNLGNLFQLQYLDLSHNNFQGPIPDAIGKIISLNSLYLASNKLEGAIPTSFWNLSNLEDLYLYYNELGGTIPQSMGNLSKLINLGLRENQFQGIITEAHFFNLSQLKFFDMMNNPQISFSLSSGWFPPFQLTELYLDGCKVGPYFPAWLRTQKYLIKLSMANAGISDAFPHWFLDIFSDLNILNISHNQIHGVIPALSKFTGFFSIDFSYNDFNSSLPILPSDGNILILSNNKFFGPLTILCNKTNWYHLDLSNNLFSGDFPNCLANSKLGYLNLAHNNFSGKIPSLNLSQINSLHLQNNSFTGEILASLENLNSTDLKFVDLSENKFTGEIPAWLGDKFPKLVFLSLRSNHFSGNIPSTWCHFAHIQVLDISLNNISGSIPKCLNNLTAMIQEVDSIGTFQFPTALYFEDYETADVTWKGEEYEYHRTLYLMKHIDLSSNNLQGEIPWEITSLESLVGLNLSRNNLTGFLPLQIGQLTSLNFLDLSRNHLYGEIPASLSHLDQLGVLDLSYNNLSGRIPWIGHLLTFSNSTYEGNSGLCGPPLTKPCPGDEIDQHPKFNGTRNQEDDKLITQGYYISMTIGYIFGFWGVIGTLVLNQSLRFAFFTFWSNIIDWLYIKAALFKRRYFTNT